jgi:hypothetical protein
LAELYQSTEATISAVPARPGFPRRGNGKGSIKLEDRRQAWIGKNKWAGPNSIHNASQAFLAFL